MKKIIHVDNSEFFRKLVKTYLAEQGLLMESYSHGATALEVIEGGDVGLIVTGLVLSDMDGMAFIKKAIAPPHNIPIVALTSSQDSEMEQELHELGIKTCILKSGAWQEELMAAVNKYF